MASFPSTHEVWAPHLSQSGVQGEVTSPPKPPNKLKGISALTAAKDYNPMSEKNIFF